MANTGFVKRASGHALGRTVNMFNSIKSKISKEKYTLNRK
jgi:hypothetical protein